MVIACSLASVLEDKTAFKEACRVSGGRRVGDGMLLPHACLLGPAHALGCICCVGPISSAVHECVASTNAPLASVLITFLGLISQWLHLVSTGVIHDKSGFVLPRKRSVEMMVHVR
jgi:hypothetical protein